MIKKKRNNGLNIPEAGSIDTVSNGAGKDEADDSRTPGGSVRVLDRAVRILGFLAESRRRVGITEIADATDLSKATVHRILSTLRDYSIVIRDDGGLYQMGPSVLFWADAYQKKAGLCEIARPWLRALWEEALETVHLFIFEGGEAYYLDKLDSPHPVGMRSHIGARRDLYSTSAGRSILAALPRPDLDAFFEKTELLPRTPNTVTDRKELEKILAVGRERGFCEEVEENEVGIRCVGAAILDLRGYPVGAVSISAPAYRFSDSQSRALGEKLRDTVLAISRELGYRG